MKLTKILNQLQSILTNWICGDLVNKLEPKNDREFHNKNIIHASTSHVNLNSKYLTR